MENKIRSIKEIEKKLERIIHECGNCYGSVKSPRAHSKMMALQWVLKIRDDL